MRFFRRFFLDWRAKSSDLFTFRMYGVCTSCDKMASGLRGLFNLWQFLRIFFGQHNLWGPRGQCRENLQIPTLRILGSNLVVRTSRKLCQTVLYHIFSFSSYRMFRERCTKKRRKKLTNVSFMHVCVAKNCEMLVFFFLFSIYSWRKKGKMLVFTRCMYVYR